jgi:hypothetical protein
MLPELSNLPATLTLMNLAVLGCKGKYFNDRFVGSLVVREAKAKVRFRILVIHWWGD